MTTLPVDVLLLILDCIYLDQSPAERQRSLAAVARSSRTLNALATPLLYSTPHLSTTPSAQKYARLFSYHVSPWGVAGGRARWPKTITPTELVISLQTYYVIICACDVTKGCSCRDRRPPCYCSRKHARLPNLLLAAAQIFDNLTSLVINDCFVDSELLARLLEEGTPLRQRIERFELVDACGCNGAFSWIFWMYRADDARAFLPWWGDSWEDEESCQWLSDTHDIDLFDAQGEIMPGVQATILKRIKHDLNLWKNFWWASDDNLTDALRWSNPFSSILAFPNLRRLSIPAPSEFNTVPIIFGRGHFRSLKHLAFTKGPPTGEGEFVVTTLDLLTLRRSVTRPHLDKLTPGPDGTILPSLESRYDTRWPAVDENVWVPLTYEELKIFETSSPAYQGPELEVLDLAEVVVFHAE